MSTQIAKSSRRVARRWIFGGLAALLIAVATFLLIAWLSARSDRIRDAARQAENRRKILALAAKYRPNPADLERRRKLIKIYRETEGVMSYDAIDRHQLAEQALSKEYPLALDAEKRREAAAASRAADQQVNAMLANEM